MRADRWTGVAVASRVLAACLTLFLSTPLLGQSDARPAAPAAADPRVIARLDAETGRQVTRLLDDARRARLPIEPLVDKALEGAAKRRPGPDILRAVRDLSGRLLEAREILGPQAADAEVTQAAHALRGGLKPAALRRLHERRGKSTLIASLGVYQELRALRVTADTAAAAVVALQEAGVSAEQIAEFQRDVARDIAVGGQPAMVAVANIDLTAGEGAFRNGSAIAGAANEGATGLSGVAGPAPRQPKKKP